MDNRPYLYYYHLLHDESLQRLYLIISEALQAHKERCAVPFSDKKDVEKVIDLVVLEQADASPFGEYTLRTLDDMVFCVEFSFLLDRNKQEVVNAETVSQAVRIATYARSKSNDPLQQIKAVHEFFVRHVRYDFDYRRFAFCAAGPLLYGRGVCMGIALAFKLILDRLHIPSICVRGEHEGEPHAWSLVQIDGCWYPFDLTVDVCRSNDREISFDGFQSLLSCEKYQPWPEMPLPEFIRKENI